MLLWGFPGCSGFRGLWEGFFCYPSDGSLGVVFVDYGGIWSFYRWLYSDRSNTIYLMNVTGLTHALKGRWEGEVLVLGIDMAEVDSMSAWGCNFLPATMKGRQPINSAARAPTLHIE
jgi:hypothetical protein